MKNSYLYFLLLVTLAVTGQNYNPVNYSFNGTPIHGVKIKTNLPYASGSQMPTIIIEGYNYGGTRSLGIMLNFYVYNDVFSSAYASSHGASAPDIKLANEGGKVVIFLDARMYYGRFTVRAFGQSLPGETSANYSGWTVVDEPVSGSNVTDVTYRALPSMWHTEGNVGSEVTYIEEGNVGIGTNSPTSKVEIQTGLNESKSLLKLKTVDSQHADHFEIRNLTEVPGQFIPNVSGTHTSDDRQALYITGNIASANDAGSVPVMTFDSRTTGAAITTRPLFSWDSYGTRKMTLSASGNLGIGTTQPMAELDVNGGIIARKPLSVFSSIAAQSDRRFTINTNNPDFTTIYNYDEGGNTFHNINIGGSSSSSNGLSIFGNGKIAIGSNVVDPGNNPLQDLSLFVNGGIAMKGGKKLALDNTYNGVHAFMQFESSLPNARFLLNGYYGHRFASSQGVNMVIERFGNVGIGTTSPTQKLEVKGSALLKSDSYVSYRLERENGAKSAYGITSNTHEAFVSSSGPLKFLTNNGNVPDTTAKMWIAESGNVGIGTISPGDWKLAVNGKIRAKEIKVETGWSDFVFEDDYNLPTLQEVEQHIEEKGHLQDIPSAAEVAENGIFLGEMDSKLLQKIEELMLYTIQQNKQIEQLLEENKKLKERVTKLENE